MERQDTLPFEVYERVREPERRSKEEMRLNCGERREILSSLVTVVTTTTAEVVTSASATDVAMEENETTMNESQDLSTENSISTASSSTTQVITCSMYTREEIRKAERRAGRERSNNYRAHRKMNKGFFKPLTKDEECSLIPSSASLASTETDDCTASTSSDQEAAVVATD